MSNEQQPSNPFAIAAGNQNALVQIASSKEAQTIQAALVVAKRFPRDQHAAYQRIMEACKRVGLAEEAAYEYSRGGTQIYGASIRLLEVIAQNWGNFQSGITELDNEDGESRVQAFAWDLETNMFDTKTFSVKHERYSTAGGTVKLTESRDIYELVANFAARRKRACMEAVIPKDIVESALSQCEKTLKTGQTEPITDRIRKLTTAFADFQVTVEMLERRLGHKLEAISEMEIARLRKIYTSLKDGMGKREDFFNLTEGPKGAKFDDAKTKEDQKKNEAAESAAGLAPAKAPATSTPSMGNVATQPAATGQAPAAAAVGQPAAGSTAPNPPADRAAKAREARAAKRAAMANPPVEPAPAVPPQPVQPQPAAAPVNPPQAAGGGQAAAPAPTDLFNQTSASAPVNRSQELAQKAYAILTTHSMTEAEVLQVFKDRQICDASVEQIVQLSDETLEDFTDGDNAEMIASQVRINRRFAAKK